jgi:streptogramin lyase
MRPHCYGRFFGRLLFAVAWLIYGAAQAQSTNNALGTSTLLVGPGAGTNSVVLAVTPATGTWTAMANTNWLHLDAADQGGTGSTNIIFTFDANPGETRSGTLTIAGQTLTITQAGSAYVQVGTVITLVSKGLAGPSGVAVDGAGNVYWADYIDAGIYEWTAASNTVRELVSSGLNQPEAVALDSVGNVYITDTGHSAIKEWTVANSNVITLVSSGLDGPKGLAVDGAGNVYIDDTTNNALKEWTVADGNVITLVTNLDDPQGAAVDIAGNVYITDTYSNELEVWSPVSSNVTLLASGLLRPLGAAVDGSGNVYTADFNDNTIRKWVAINGTEATLVSNGLNHPAGVTVDAAGNIYIGDQYNNEIKELPYAFVDPTYRLESLSAGSDTLPAVLPTTENLTGPLAPTSDSPWLTITGVTNGVVNFAFSATVSNRTGYIMLLGQTIPIVQGGASYSLGLNSLVVGPAAGTNSVVLAVVPAFFNWTNTANASWLHLSPANQDGAGSTNVVFSYDANAGATRSGTLAIGDQTLTVTQAGSTYAQVLVPVTTLVGSGLSEPSGVAVDTVGNVYIADTFHRAIKEWHPTNDSVTTLVSSGLTQPNTVAVDGTGNVYIADGTTIKEWSVESATLTTLVSSGLAFPSGVAVDAVGNVYIADRGNSTIKEWMRANSNVTTLVSSGLSAPYGVALDAAGNVYTGDSGHTAIKEWIVASGMVVELATVISPDCIAVDGAGNVYTANGIPYKGINKWTAATGSWATLVPSNSTSNPSSVAVDGTGNVYIADAEENAINELFYAFVDSTPKVESLSAGSDSLPMVLPATENLLPPFTPFSDQPWLTITSVTNDVVSFAFSAATSNRTGYITLLGQTIPITQGGPSYSIGVSALIVGPNAGSNSVVLAVAPYSATWTNTANASWLHLSGANQNGVGSTNIFFNYDANPGVTRLGTLTVAEQTLTVTQAGSIYVAAGTVTTLDSNGLSSPSGVAVDGSGNAYWADYGNSAVYEWTVANNTATELVSSGLNGPEAVAVDSAGNVYITDTVNNAIKEWTVATSNVITLVSNGLSGPKGVAVDVAGNVYIADTGHSAIKEWTPGNTNVTTLVSSGLSGPQGVAVDIAGNVYINDTGHNELKEWIFGSTNVITLVSSGLDQPLGAAVDGSGNVYMAGYGDNTIKEWTAASKTVATLVSSGLSHAAGVTVDGTGNIFIGDQSDNAVKELPYAFVDPTPKSETAAAGSDSLPVVLPVTENLLAPFNPVSDQPWLTINNVIGGVVTFSFTVNTNSVRTGHITLLGQSVPVTQGVIGTPPTLTGAQLLGNGVLQFSFTNDPNSSFTVLSTTNLTLPFSNWVVVGTASNIGSGQFQFTSPPITNDSQIFFGVRSP